MAFEKGHTPWHKGRHGCFTDESIRKMSESHKGKPVSWKVKQGHPAWNKGKHRCYTEETLKRMSEANKGHVGYWEGKHLTDDTRKMLSNVLKAKGIRPSDEARQKSAELRKRNGLTEEHKRKLAMSAIGRKMSPSARVKMSQSHMGVPLSEAHKIALTTAVFKSCREKRPTKPEKLLGEIIETICPNQYKYTGNGEMRIGYLNPDYTNVNGQKKVIEAYGDYWHRGENPQVRIDIFRKYGFDCLIVWEYEIKKEPEKVTQKVLQFNEARKLEHGVSSY